MIDTVLFDAAGTLIEVAEPVGETYARLARAEGLDADARSLDQAFRAAFRAAPPLTFPPSSPETLRRREREWWRELVGDTFRRARLGNDAAAVARVFAAAFERYARGSAWRAFPDVRPTLERLRERGAKLAVVSNFDDRLRGVLADLELSHFFAAVVVSSEHGSAKPDPRIFEAALRRVGARAEATLHVGDSIDLDIAGARAAGIAALRIDRSGVDDEHTITSLTHLIRHKQLFDFAGSHQ